MISKADVWVEVECEMAAVFYSILQCQKANQNYGICALRGTNADTLITLCRKSQLSGDEKIFRDPA